LKGAQAILWLLSERAENLLSQAFLIGGAPNAIDLRSMIACALVTAFFLSSEPLVPILVRRLVLPPRKKKILVAAIIFSVFAKLAVTQLSIATMPESVGDYTTWKTVAGLMAEHKSVRRGVFAKYLLPVCAKMLTQPPARKPATTSG
jgi:hypothetical protein